MSEDIVKPTRITKEMLRLAYTEDLVHYAENLNAMLQFGYCNKCGLTPDGCIREGCSNAGFRWVNGKIEEVKQ